VAKTVWHTKADLQAFRDGQAAAHDGLGRSPIKRYPSYNERAAFHDGWDSIMRFSTVDLANWPRWRR